MTQWSVRAPHRERARPLLLRRPSDVGMVLRLLGLFALSRTARLPVGRSALWLTLVRAIGLRAALPLSAGLILLRAMAKRGAKPGYVAREDRVA